MCGFDFLLSYIVCLILSTFTPFDLFQCKNDLQAALEDFPFSYARIWILLLSFLWPAAGFWGSTTIHQQASYVTYTDPVQRSLGVLKTWFWVALNVFFSSYACNIQLSPSFHQHVSQSSLVIYVFSRFFESVWLRHVFPAETTGLGIIGTFWLCYPLTILSCVALYFVFNSNKATRIMFGLS